MPGVSEVLAEKRRLEQENEQLQAEWEEQRKCIERLSEEASTLRDERYEWKKRAERAEAELNQERAKRSELGANAHFLKDIVQVQKERIRQIHKYQWEAEAEASRLQSLAVALEQFLADESTSVINKSDLRRLLEGKVSDGK